MPLNKRQDRQLQTIIWMMEELRKEAAKQTERNGGGRSRRSSEEAQRMREDIIASRAKGVAASELAKKYGVSTAYIYMIKA